MRNLIIALLGCALLWACNQPKSEEHASVTKQPMEIGDSKYIDISKQMLRDICEGNVDAFTAQLSDNTQFNWNYLDSLLGKDAIVEYWKDRRTKVIDTLTYTGDIWIVVKANEPPAKGLPTGTWVFGWYKATAKYIPTGKSMTQWIHQVQHFDEKDKVDYTAQFLDRIPIHAALRK